MFAVSPASVTSPEFVPESFALFRVEDPIISRACEVVESVNPVVVVAIARPLYEETFDIVFVFRFTLVVAPVYGTKVAETHDVEAKVEEAYVNVGY